MDGVNGVRTSYPTPLKGTDGPAPSVQDKADSSAMPSVRPQGSANTADNARLSSLAHLLSEAATRAAQRDASTDRTGLAAIAERATRDIHSPVYESTKAARDAEVPNSDDPQRLAQARQATAFNNNQGANPFKGLSLDQLTLITHDESGAFTVNERHAAWIAAYEEQENWGRAVSNQLMAEYNRDGHFSPDTLKGILDYYKSLPAILEAELVDSYEADLNSIIETAERAEAQGQDRLQSLLDLVTSHRHDAVKKARETDA